MGQDTSDYQFHLESTKSTLIRQVLEDGYWKYRMDNIGIGSIHRLREETGAEVTNS